MMKPKDFSAEAVALSLEELEVSPGFRPEDTQGFQMLNPIQVIGNLNRISGEIASIQADLGKLLSGGGATEPQWREACRSIVAHGEMISACAKRLNILS